MESVLSQRVHSLVEDGWEPQTTTETTATLVGRRPFAWWLFIIVIFLFPLFGGILYLIFWLATSKATVFLHVENGEVLTSGDQWLLKLQEARRKAYVEKERQIKERGFLRVMWPQLLASLLLLIGWFALLKWYF